MKIGFLGGTFDPIHLGHLFLAVQLKEARKLDEIWLCPARLNPFKEEGGVSVDHRLAMVQIAVKNCPYIKVLDVEVKREGPSYTIETLRFLKKEHPQDQFSLLLGEDSIQSFEQWQFAEEIARTFPIYTGTRTAAGTLEFKNKVVEKAILSGLTPLPRVDISATDVRNRLRDRLYCGHLLNQEVLDYILRFDLYFNGIASK